MGARIRPSDVVAALLLLVVALAMGLLVWLAFRLPPLRFEPIGSPAACTDREAYWRLCP